MRQRYLLGKYNQAHYGTELGDSDLLEKGGGLYVQSTDVNRTIVSGYSELLGMINGTNMPFGPNLTHAQVVGLEHQSRGVVPFLARNASTVKSNLTDHAIVDGFINYPIYLEMEMIMENDLGD